MVSQVKRQQQQQNATQEEQIMQDACVIAETERQINAEVERRRTVSGSAAPDAVAETQEQQQLKKKNSADKDKEEKKQELSLPAMLILGGILIVMCVLNGWLVRRCSNGWGEISLPQMDVSKDPTQQETEKVSLFFFALCILCLIYIFAFGLVVYPRMCFPSFFPKSWRISEECRNFLPMTAYWGIAALDTGANVAQTIGQPKTPNVLAPILDQLQIPFTLALAYFFLQKVFSKAQLAGAAVVIVGVMVSTLGRGSQPKALDASTGAILLGTCVYLLKPLFYGCCGVYKESVFNKAKEGVEMKSKAEEASPEERSKLLEEGEGSNDEEEDAKPVDIDIWYFSQWINIYQFILTLAMVPVTMIPGFNGPENPIRLLADGFNCFVRFQPVIGDYISDPDSLVVPGAGFDAAINNAVYDVNPVKGWTNFTPEDQKGLLEYNRMLKLSQTCQSGGVGASIVNEDTGETDPASWVSSLNWMVILWTMCNMTFTTLQLILVKYGGASTMQLVANGLGVPACAMWFYMCTFDKSVNVSWTTESITNNSWLGVVGLLFVVAGLVTYYWPKEDSEEKKEKKQRK